MRASIAAVCVLSVMGEQAYAGDGPAQHLLQPAFSVSQEFGTTFSRTVAFTSPGYEDVVRRVSGTGAYRVTKISDTETVLDGRFLYDGSPVSSGTISIRDGGRTLCWNGQCSLSTDASGLTMNPNLWGIPPKKLHAGQSWTVQVSVPWELGPPGQETITVVAVDAKRGLVSMKREGSGQGNSADDIKHITFKAKSESATAELKYGKTTWTGYTTFQRGITWSDTLLMQRPFTAIVNGKDVAGMERQYILLNQSDPSPLWH